MTHRQVEAFVWLQGVGKASGRLAAREGFSQRTMDALVRRGVATVEHVGIVRPRPVYRLKRG